jgi:hypothetical protein
VHCRDIYIAPKTRWTLVGATNERGKADTTVDRKVVEGLRAKAAELAGGLADAPEAGSWAGIAATGASTGYAVFSPGWPTYKVKKIAP